MYLLNKSYKKILILVGIFNLFTLGNLKEFFFNDLICNNLTFLKYFDKFVCLYFDKDFLSQFIYSIFLTFFSFLFFLFYINKLSKKTIYLNSFFYILHNYLLFLETNITFYIFISLSYFFILILFQFSSLDIFEIKFEILYSIFFINIIFFLNPNSQSDNNIYFIGRQSFYEFIISYSGSFHRRGALGSFVMLFSNSKDSLILNTYFLMIILEILLLFLIFKLLKNVNQTLKFILLFSPLGFFFHIKLEEFGRKDVLILILFLIFLNSIQNTKLSTFIILFFGIFVMLSHEGLFFYLPFYLVANYRIKKELGKNHEFNSIDISIAFLGLIGISLLTIFSKLQITVSKYELYLKSKNLSGVKNPAIEYLLKDASFYISEIRQILTFEIFAYWFILFLLVPVLAYWIGLNLNIKTYSWLNIIFVIPLFSAQDWGRWLFLFFMHFLILEIYFIKRGNLNFKFKKLFVFFIIIFSFTSIPTGPQQETFYEYEMKFKINLHRYIVENFIGNFEYSMYKY